MNNGEWGYDLYFDDPDFPRNPPASIYPASHYNTADKIAHPR